MSSPLGDALRNPAIKPAESGKEVSTFARGVRALATGAARNFDTLTNIGDVPGKVLGFFLKRFLPKELKEALEMFDDMPGFLEGNIKKSLPEIPKAESYKDRLAEGIGTTLSDLPLIAAPFSNPAMRTLGNFLAAGGGAAAQTAGSPIIEDLAPNNPYVQIPANLALGMGGALAGGGLGKALSGKSTRPLPEMTAAQRAPEESEELWRLLSKEKDLVKKDPKSAQVRYKIQKNQHQKISDSLDFPESTTGEEIVDAIQDAFENLKQERGGSYRADLAKSIEGTKIDAPIRYDTKTGKPIQSPIYREVTTEGTGELIDELKRQVPIGGDTDKMLTSVADFIAKQKGDPWRLNGLKKELADKIEYSPLSALYLGNSKNSVMKMIVKKITEEMNEQIPGYSKVLGDYANRSQALKKLQKGVVGDYVKSGDKKPSEVIKKIFENPNKHVVEELKTVLSPELYEKAAQTYLKEIVNETLGKASINQENKFHKFYKLREHLENNSRALSNTLPEQYQPLIKDTISKIKTAEVGIPRNDFTSNSGRSIALGNEVKGLGTGLGLTKKIVSKLGGNYLNREEMLTGISPAQQIGKGIKHLGKQGAIQGGIATDLSESSLPPSNNIADQLPQNPNLNFPSPSPQNDMDVEDFLTFSQNMPERDIEVKHNKNNDISDFMSFSENMKKGRK